MKIITALKNIDNRKALYASMIFMMILILAFLLLSMEQPDPPLQEEVIEIEMEFQAPSGGGGSPSKTSTKPKTNPTSAEEIDTQDEPSVTIPPGKSDDKNTDNTQKPEPKSNNEFTLPNSNSGQNGQGGKLGGENGVNDNNGPGGKDLYTTNRSRKLINSGGITQQSQEEGKIALDIWVDEKGNVVRTKYNATHSTSGSDKLKVLARKWAFTMEYEKNIGAGIQKVKYVVFTFSKH